MTFDGGDKSNPNRTVFRPSPLQSRPAPEGQPASPFDSPAAPTVDPFAASAVAQPRLPDDDIPRPPTAQKARNLMAAKAAPLLALAASVRSGRARVGLAELHAEASRAITEFDRAVVEAGYPEDQRMRARYALAATVDDIAQNLPGGGTEGAEWARRSLVVQFFQEAIGGDRFWQLVDNMLATPSQYGDLIELYHACLAAGFQGRFRVTADGHRQHAEVMQRLYSAIEHVRRLSTTEVSPHWRGKPTPTRRIGFWSILALGAGLAGLLLVGAYIFLRITLIQTGEPSLAALRDLNPDDPLRLSRVAPAPPPPTSTQLQVIQGFLAPEIRQKLVMVEQDATTIRVRTTVGQLFASGSDTLDPARRPLFERIAAALEPHPGRVTVEGYTDSDRVRTVTFPDNVALSQARADQVAALIRKGLTRPSRVVAEGYGENRPIASNATTEGKALNRRVEVVIPRNDAS